MNYIKHLNSVFKRFAKDENLKANDISLYMALFQIWNQNRFSEMIYLNRQEVMKLAKIGSLKTYHRGLKYLDERRYIRYFPSHDPMVGSRVKLLRFKGSKLGKKGTTGATTSTTTGEQHAEQPLPHIENSNKPLKTLDKQPCSKNVVTSFFRSKRWPEIEAIKFYNHYQATGWKLGGRARIQDWQAVAESWMIRAGERKQEIHTLDNLKTSKFKNYGEPL